MLSSSSSLQQQAQAQTMAEDVRLKGKSSIAAQLSKILTEKVFESLLEKSSKILEPQVLSVLRDRWMQQLHTRGYSFRNEVTDASENASTETMYCLQQRQTKRLREEVSPLERICDIFQGSGDPHALDVSATRDNRLRIVYKVKTRRPEDDVADVADQQGSAFTSASASATEDFMWQKRQKSNLAGELIPLDSAPLVCGSKVKVRSGVTGRERIGRISCFTNSKFLRVRFPSGYEELVSYESTDTTLSTVPHSPVGTSSQVVGHSLGVGVGAGVGLPGGLGVATDTDKDAEVDADEEVTGLNYLEGIHSSLSEEAIRQLDVAESGISSMQIEKISTAVAGIFPTLEKPNKPLPFQTVLTASTTIGSREKSNEREPQPEESFAEIERYFDSFIGKKLHVTINQHLCEDDFVDGSLPIRASSTSSASSVLSHWSPEDPIILSADEDPTFTSREAPPSAWIVGMVSGRILRRRYDWVVTLRNAILRINQQEFLFSSVAVKVDPTSIIVPCVLGK